MSSDNHEMESKKRKPAGSDDVSDSTKKAREVHLGQATVTEDEVEEFFTILRRIRVAIKYFDKGDGDGSTLRDEKSRLWAALEREGAEEVNGVKGEVKRGEGVERDLGFDLNANPSSE